MSTPLPKNCAPAAIQEAVDRVAVEHLVHRWRFLRRRVGHLTGLAINERDLDGRTWAYVPKLPAGLASALRIEVGRRRGSWKRSL